MHGKNDTNATLRIPAVRLAKARRCAKELAATILVATGLAVGSPAQNTWIVNAGGGSANFTDLPSAVQAAADGDTIVVQTGPFNEGAVGFTTDKGLTIVGEGGRVPIFTAAAQPVAVVNLPAGSRFRMSGFSRPSDGKLHVRIEHCDGSVHLGEMRCREHLLGPEYDPGIIVNDSRDVTLRAVGTYGNPALQIDGSRVIASNCQFGRTYIGLGTGPCLRANYSTVDVVEPLFNTNGSYFAAIEAFGSDLRIVGSSSSHVTNSGFAIAANDGTVAIDPRVQLSVWGPWGASIVGSASVTTMPMSATFAVRNPGSSNLDLSTVAPVGKLVTVALGAPRPLVATPFGVLGIDVLQPVGFLVPQNVPAGGVVTTTLNVPAALALGTTFTSQATVIGGGQIEISLPSTVVVF